MKDLSHQNINTFIGACVEPGNICILSQYCAKGSLQVKKVYKNMNYSLKNLYTFMMCLHFQIHVTLLKCLTIRVCISHLVSFCRAQSTEKNDIQLEIIAK